MRYKADIMRPVVTVWTEQSTHLGAWLLYGDWTLDMVFTACNRIEELEEDIASLVYKARHDQTLAWTQNMAALISMRCSLDMEGSPSLSVGDLVEVSSGLQLHDEFTCQPTGWTNMAGDHTPGFLPHPHNPNPEGLTP